MSSPSQSPLPEFKGQAFGVLQNVGDIDAGIRDTPLSEAPT